MSRTVRAERQYKYHRPYAHVALRGGMVINARSANLWCHCCRQNPREAGGKDRDEERRMLKRRERQQVRREIEQEIY